LVDLPDAVWPFLAGLPSFIGERVYQHRGWHDWPIPYLWATHIADACMCDSLTYQFLTRDSGATAEVTQLDSVAFRPDIRHASHGDAWLTMTAREVTTR
jgi:hypothetical protein